MTEDGTPAATDERHEALVRATAAVLGLPVSDEDLPGVVAHLATLRGFAASLGDPAAEPAPVYRP